jgi:hypothetical protein
MVIPAQRCKQASREAGVKESDLSAVKSPASRAFLFAGLAESSGNIVAQLYKLFVSLLHNWQINQICQLYSLQFPCV